LFEKQCVTCLRLSQENVGFSISMFSRKIKELEEPPNDVLFRTHHYEFEIRPTKEFFTWCGRRSGFVVDLKLFKRHLLQTDYSECTDCGVPIISYTFTESYENVDSCKWNLQLNWPERGNYNWKGKFFFRISVFRKVDSDTMRRIAIRESNEFTVYSKPNVYIKQLQKAPVDKKKRESSKQPTPIKKRLREESKEQHQHKKSKENRFYEEDTTDVIDLCSIEPEKPSLLFSNKLLEQQNQSLLSLLKASPSPPKGSESLSQKLLSVNNEKLLSFSQDSKNNDEPTSVFSQDSEPVTQLSSQIGHDQLFFSPIYNEKTSSQKNEYCKIPKIEEKLDLFCVERLSQ
jgi:hypothetical protein